MWFHENMNIHVGVGQPFILNDVQYPGNWLETISDSELLDLGFVKVKKIGQRRDDRYFDNSEVMDGGFITITANPKDIVTVRYVALADISDCLKEMRYQVAGTSDDAEIAGWSNKLEVAQDIISGSATDADKLAFQAEILARGNEGETLYSFAQKVISNANLFAQAVAFVDGMRRKAHDAIESARSIDEVVSVIEAVKSEMETEIYGLINK